jgi:hypothetical protein
MRGRHLFMVLPLLAGLALPPASAQVGVSVGISVPGVQIGINLPAYPALQPVPGYPVYYAPALLANYFFYDGLYWVYVNDSWYSSTWYNGPWYVVEPAVVPVFILRVPVRYYRVPPPYFRGWAMAAPPRWGEHWGPGWEAHHRGWDHWDRHAAPRPAPLPLYQRQYEGGRYPQPSEQVAIRERRYTYQPRDERVRERVAQETRHVERGHGRAAPPQRTPAAPHDAAGAQRARQEQERSQAEAQRQRQPQHARQSPEQGPPEHPQRDARDRPQEQAPAASKHAEPSSLRARQEAHDERRAQDSRGPRERGDREGA